MSADWTAINRVRAEFPAGFCRGLCVGSCYGPVEHSDAEHAQLVELGVTLPTPAGDPAGWARALDAPDYRCPALGADNRCTVYDDRPTVCREWGASELHPCPFGCVPDGGRIPPRRAWRLILRALAAGGVSLMGGTQTDVQAALAAARRGEPVPPMVRMIARYASTNVRRMSASRREAS